MARDRTSSPYEVTLCTFGKHPGWDDHMECLGLETHALQSLHRDLYQQGIGSNIGSWDEIAKRNEKGLLPFNHDFIWQKHDDTILGRMWYSKDGKGRDRYPMVTCIHAHMVPLAILLKDVDPLLLAAEKKYVATNSASEVRSIFYDTKERIKERLGDLPTPAGSFELTPMEAFERLKRLNPIQGSLNDFSRILFVIENNLSIKSGSVTATVSASLHPIRLPVDATSFKDSAVIWTSFLNSQLRKNIPRIYFFPANSPWCDVIVGAPIGREYNYIKLPIENIPLTSNDHSIVVNDEFARRIDANLAKISKSEGRDISPLIKVNKRSRESEVHRNTMKFGALIADSLREETQSIDKHLVKKVLIILSLMAVLVAIAIAIIMKQQPAESTKSAGSDPKIPSPPEKGATVTEPEAWKNLCLEYDTWFGSFYSELNDARKQRWSEDKELQKVVKLLEKFSTAGKKIDPIQIAGVKGSYRHLADNPPNDTITTEVRTQITHANNLVKQIKQILTTKQEKVQELLESLHLRYKALGWNGPLRILNSIREMIPKNDQAVSSEISVILDNYFEVKDKLEEIGKLSENVQTRLEIIRSSGDSILTQVDNYVDSQLKDVKDLGEFNSKLKVLTGVDHIMTELAAFTKNQWGPEQVHIELFKSESHIHRHFKDRINESILVAWLNEVQEYRWLDVANITGTKEEWQKDLIRIDENIQKLSEDSRDSARGFSEQLEVLKQEVTLDIPYIQKNQAKLSNQVKTLTEKINSLADAVEYEIATGSTDPCAWVESIKSIRLENPSILDRIRVSRSHELLKDIRCEELSSDPKRDLQVRLQVRKIQQFFKDFNNKFPSAISVDVLDPKNWHSEFQGLVKEKREGVLTKIISLITWNGGVPDTEFQEFIHRDRPASLCQEYLGWLEQMNRVFSDFQVIENKITKGYLPNEKIRHHDSDTTIGGLFDLWFKGDFFKKNSALVRILEPISSPIKLVHKISSEQEVNALMADALDNKNILVYTLTAWRRLGEMDWPTTSDNHQKMNEIYERLSTSITSIDNTARIEELQGKLKQEKVAYDLRYQNAVFQRIANVIESGIQELSRDTPDDGKQIESITEKFNRIVAEKKQFDDGVATRMPVQDDIKTIKRLHVLLRDVKNEVDEAMDPWAEIEKLRKLQQVSTDYPDLNNVWQTWRDQVLDGVTQEKLGKTSKRILSIKTDLENSFKVLKTLGGDVDFNSNIRNLIGEFSDSPWRHDIEAIIQEKRKAMILEYLDNTNPDSRMIKEKFESWREVLCDLAINLHELAKRLDAGFTLHSKWENGTINTLFESWRIKLSRFNELRSLAEPLENRIKKLRSIDKDNGRDIVNQEKGRERYEPELSMTIWEKTRVLDDWPASLDELKQEANLRTNVRQLLPAISGIDRTLGASLEKELNTEGQERWLLCLKQLTRDSEMDAAFSLKDEFGVQREELSPTAQYNLSLYEFKYIDFDAYSDDRIMSISRDFIETVGHKAQVKDAQKVTNFLQELESAMSGENVGNDDPFSGVGPSSSLVGNELIMNVVNDGKRIEYKWANDVLGEDSFRFIRVGSNQGDVTPFYLCSTEVSLGLFIQVIARTDKWQEINAFIPEEANDPLREGPWLWDYDDGNFSITTRSEWVNTPSLEESANYYPKGRMPEGPSRSHPMHHISPHAAVYFAALLRCRLPSPDEWKVANKVYPNTQGRNIRDKTWEAHKQHIVRLQKEQRIRVSYSDSAIFWPTGGIAQPRKIGKNAEGDFRYNDGTLWFQRVNSSGIPDCSHLVGNVAEYVFDKSDLYDKNFNKRSPISVENVLEFTKKYATNFFVIGGSALSPLALDVSKPYPVEMSNQRLGYSDVGLRLAFSAPIISLSAQVKAIVQKQSYIFN